MPVPSWKNPFLAAALVGVLALTGCGQGTGAAPSASSSSPVAGGILTYLDAQPHTSLYPPSGGFYPNGGLVNQITDRLVYQDPTTLATQNDSLRIDAAARREFGALARSYGAQLQVAQSLQGVRRDVE